MASDQGHESYADDAKARRNLLVSDDGTPISGTNKLPVEAELTVGDIEIGAVELKDGTTDTRAVVSTDGSNNALHVQGTNIDIRDLTSASDSVEVIQGTAAGTIISGIDTTKALGTLEFNSPFSTGLTVVSVGGVKCTVVYE